MIELKPIRETSQEYDEIEKKIKDLFKREIYIPLIKEFSDNAKSLKNSKEDLNRALQSGRLTYSKGKFSGKLNATLTKELKALGAKWDKSEQCFSLPYPQLPIDLRGAISLSTASFNKKLEMVDRKLASVVPEELASKLKISKLFDQTLWKMDSQFQRSVGNITVAPKLTDQAAKRIAEDWQSNMEIWIKDFSVKEIENLRGDIRKSFFAGNRYESAIETIQKSYGVTARKAKFLARQETALLMTTFKEERYQDAGINEYKWRAVAGTPLHPVRPMHKELSDRSKKGEIFRFDNPPVDDPNGSRHNPGQNYNCRCVAVPVVRFKKQNPK